MKHFGPHLSDHEILPSIAIMTRTPIVSIIMIIIVNRFMQYIDRIKLVSIQLQ